MLDDLLSASEELAEVTFADGTQVIVEGQEQRRLLILVSGSVHVSREQVPIAVIDEPGALFGELAALLRLPASATVTAIGDCTFRACDDADTFLRSRPEVALAVATLLGRRLHTLTQYLVDVRQQYAGRDDHLGVVDVVLESLSHHQGAAPDPGSDREPDAPY
jgi:CRP/FNR family cyclic AMP-dependent transcriptional regulator